jgi:Tol biopolymer transport system component
MNKHTLRLLAILGVLGSLLGEPRAQAVSATHNLRTVMQPPINLTSTQGQTCTTKRVSPQTVAVAPTSEQVFRASSHPIISADGRLVAYESSAVLEAEDNPWFNSMLVVVDQSTGTTERVDVNTEGQPANDSSRLADMTLDGSYVAFTSYANNLVNGTPQGSLFIRDRVRRVTELVPIPENLRQGLLVDPVVALSADARYVAFGNLDLANVYVYDRARGMTELISLEPGNLNQYSLDPDISADGRYVAFTSGIFGEASKNVFVRDRMTGVTALVSIGVAGQPGGGASPSISDDGRYVAFVSSASNLVEGDTNNADDVFVRDQVQKLTERVSLSSTGQQANGLSLDPAISPDGQYVAFRAEASNLTEGDTNNVDDVFVRDRVQKVTERVNLSSSGQQADGPSFQPQIADSGRAVVFSSDATNLAAEDTNGVSDVFIRTCTNNLDNTPSGFSIRELQVNKLPLYTN